eukprot:jgi/Psemu1/187022/e_gw1.64.65.1
MINRISLLFLIPYAFAFVEQCHFRQNGVISRSNRKGSSSQCRYLIPLAKFDESVGFFSEPEKYRCCIDDKGYFASTVSGGSDSCRYELGLIEEEELPDLCKFVVTAFGAEAIQLSSDMNSFERMLLNPAAEFLNGYSGMVAFAEVFSGTKQRLADRFREHQSQVDISAPDLKGLSREERIRKAERDSLVLILGRPTKDANDNNSKSMEVIASIELRLQPCDAKIPFSIPWLDRVERRIGSLIGLGSTEDGAGSNDLQPYLSNLCVDEKFRGQKIGRGLVRCVESIAKNSWGYNRMYLHVDEDNLAALNLYKSEGYRDVGHRWNPFWSGGASEIGYYVKSLSSTP